MTLVELTEHGPAATLRLPDAAGRALAASGLVTAAPDPHVPGAWRLRAGSRVGAVRLAVPGGESLELRIAPKLPVARLFFLLGYARDPKTHGAGTVGLAAHDEVLPALAHAYERALERALRQGVLQGYRRTEESAPVLRGRLREAEQLRRHLGRALPLEVAYDAYGTDTAENRLLRAAAERLLRLPRVPRAVRQRLRHHGARLGGAARLAPGAPLPRWRPSRLNARYWPALRLAETVLRGSSVELAPGGVAVEGFVCDMNAVFEDFVCVALREALAAYGGRTVLQQQMWLDEDGAVRMRPDLVWYGADGRPRAVVDAKYKAASGQAPDGGLPHADLYQMLAYCTALGLPRGHLVHAGGGAPRGAHRVRGAGVVLHRHALDLDQPPERLLAAVRELAARLAQDAAAVAQGTGSPGASAPSVSPW